MITIHELGHYTFGKILKFKINEFSIGFGKALFKRTMKSGEIFSIRLVPLGGYCAFAGEDEDADDPNAFNNKAPWKRMIVLFGGVCFNFLSAILFSFILLLGFGYDIPQVSQVNPEFQDVNVLYVDDISRQIDGVNIDFVTDNTTPNLLSRHYTNMTQEEKANYTLVTIDEQEYKRYNNLALTVQRDGELKNLVVNYYVFTTGDSEKENMTLGFNTVAYRHTLGESLVRAVPLTAGFAWKVLSSLWLMLTGAISLADMGGPITTITTMAEYSQLNIANLFVFLPFIAANLAVFNILPIPALDGARMVFTGIEWVRRKPIKREIEAKIHTAGLIVLFALVIGLDIYHIIF